MFTKTQIALSTAIIVGTASVILANHAFAESTSNLEYGLWENEWVVQGDTWLHRDQLQNGTHESNTNGLVPKPSGQPSSIDPKLRDCAR